MQSQSYHQPLVLKDICEIRVKGGESWIQSRGPDPGPTRISTTFHVSANTLSRPGLPLKAALKFRFLIDCGL